MYHFYIVREGDKEPRGMVREVPYRWAAVEGIGWVLIEYGPYRLGNWLVNKAMNHETYMTEFPLPKDAVEAIESFQEDVTILEAHD